MTKLKIFVALALLAVARPRSSQCQYEEGEIVTVTATEEPGKKFNCWYISADGSETVENDNASFSFEMPATDLIITAMYDLE